MPIYEYQCETCDLRFDIEQSFSEDTLVKCPTKKSGKNPEGCTSSGRGRVAKVFSAPGITFKGTGFYKNDSRSGSSSSSSASSSSTGESSSSDSSSSSSSSDTKKSETKAEKKSDTTTKSDTKKSKTSAKD